MATDWTTAAWFLPFVIPITVWVAWSDLATMKIPNKAVLALMVVFVVVGLVAVPFNEYLWRYAHFGVVIVIGFVLSAAGLMGAGDAKFGAAMAPFIPLADLGLFFFILAAATGAALILHLIIRYTSLKNLFPTWESLKPEEDRSLRKKHIPYGFGLAPALMFYFLLALYVGFA